MNEQDKTVALFRLSVLGQLTARAQLGRGELKAITRELSMKTYDIPNSRRCHLSAKTIERWYYAWQRGGFDALATKRRVDHGQSSIDVPLQTAICQLKKDNPARSLNTILRLLQDQGLITKDSISRATLHRFLQNNGISGRVIDDAATIERRSFTAVHAGDIWQGDVLHGPTIMTKTGKHKTYLVSLLDDASRLIAHSAFCLGETALDIEGVLKEALLKRGVPKKIIIDNGPAYRSKSLQQICANMGIQLVYCRPYEPEGKGKLERFHRTFRGQFLSELVLENIQDLHDLNSRLWAWIDQYYHQCPHGGLTDKQTPLARWRADLRHIQTLGIFAQKIDDYFYHRILRRVKKDGSVSWDGELFEVDYKLVGKKINLVVDAHEKIAIKAESIDGAWLSEVSVLNRIANLKRHRQRPIVDTKPVARDEKVNLVELAHTRQQQQLCIDDTADNTPSVEE